MRKLIKFIFQLVILLATVGLGFFAAREWQKNKPYYKSRLVGLKNKLQREVKVGSEAAYQTAIEMRSQFQQESENFLKEASETAETIKASKPVKKAVDIIEKVIPGEQFPKTTKTKGLTPRQNVIYAIIKGKKTVEMKDLLMRISGITERTLRRDLLKLQELKLITKKGTTKSATYVLK